MRVGNPEPVEHALNRAVFAETAMQGVEYDVRFRIERANYRGEIRADFDRQHVKALFSQGADHLLAGIKTDLALGGDAAVEDRDPRHTGFSACSPSPAGGRGPG